MTIAMENLGGKHRQYLIGIHPNAVSTCTTIEMDGENVLTVLVVETNLNLNFEDPHYDEEKVGSLVGAVQKHFSAHRHAIDRVRIISVANDSSAKRF